MDFQNEGMYISALALETSVDYSEFHAQYIGPSINHGRSALCLLEKEPLLEGSAKIICFGCRRREVYLL